MIISLKKLKYALKLAKNIMIEDYMKGTQWKKFELLSIVDAVQNGELTDQKSTLIVSHLNSYVQRHYLCQEFYMIFCEALYEVDDDAKVFINQSTNIILEQIYERSKNINELY